MSDEVIDLGAREYTSNVKKELKGQIAKLEARIKVLEAKVQALETRPSSGFDEARVNDHAWTKAGERLYAELANPNSEISKFVRDLATGKR